MRSYAPRPRPLPGLDENSLPSMESFEAHRSGINFALVQFEAACDRLVKKSAGALCRASFARRGERQ